MTPKARIAGLLTQEVGAEVVVYDQERHEALRLNESAALVWRHCDGHTSVSELAGLLHAELGLPRDNGLVWSALTQLERFGLLQEPMSKARLSVGHKVALAGALALLVPVVESLLVPEPAAAYSW